jgi:hypothetical protein
VTPHAIRPPEFGTLKDAGQRVFEAGAELMVGVLRLAEVSRDPNGSLFSGADAFRFASRLTEMTMGKKRYRVPFFPRPAPTAAVELTDVAPLPSDHFKTVDQY